MTDTVISIEPLPENARVLRRLRALQAAGEDGWPPACAAPTRAARSRPTTPRSTSGRRRTGPQ